jgi:hypothetical protein
VGLSEIPSVFVQTPRFRQIPRTKVTWTLGGEHVSIIGESTPMKRIAVMALFILSLTSYGQTKERMGKRIVLPNPRLLRCQSSDCGQLWQDTPHGQNEIYPKQVVVDLFSQSPCPLGVMAYYDKSVSMDDLKSAIDERYGKWAFANNNTAPVKLWRVQSEKFSIQLSDMDKRIAKLAKLSGDREEIGTKTVIYMAFQPPHDCSFP